MILPLGRGRSIFLGESESRIYPNRCAKFGCGPTVVSKGGGGYRQRDKGTLQLYIVDVNLFIFLLFSKDDRSRYLCICDPLLS